MIDSTPRLQPASTLIRQLLRFGAAAFVVTFVVACGGVASDGLGESPADSSSSADVAAQTESMTVNLVASNSRSAATSTEATKAANAADVSNLLDLSGLWNTWDGTDSGISVDTATNTLQIPVPVGDMAIGVQRYDQPLEAGSQYELQVQADNNEAAAVMFLFDASGNIVTINTRGDQAAARNGLPFTFVAPAGVAGFYLQVQNQWQAALATELTARLSVQSGSQAEANESTGTDESSDSAEAGDENTLAGGNNLILTRGDWLDWAGQFTGVTSSSSGTQLFIPAAAPDASNAIGVRHFNIPLQAGVEYEWSMAVSDGKNTGPSALIFLFNSQSRPIRFVDPATQTSSIWLATAAGESRRFRVPADVTGFAVQVQSGFRASATSLVTPMLRRLPESNDGQANEALEAQLQALISNGSASGLAAFTMPLSDDLLNIPQSATNPLTPAKVALGAMLFHETALSTGGNNPALEGTWSCAACHQVSAGFKAGIPQGIGEGGSGFGTTGEGRRLVAGFDALAPDDDPAKPDTQPVASPTVLNSAYQAVMLWNGQFGNDPDDSINADVDPARLLTVETPKAHNSRGLPGLEIQAVAGLGVHRLEVENNSVLQTNPEYQALFAAAYPDGSEDVLEDAAKAIAAYERTLLANDAPFQRWLRGEAAAMTARELRGAIAFFGDAGCAACHRGPALSSEPGAGASDVFFAVGFADFDLTDPIVHGVVSDADSRGRGGFTGVASDDYQFKIAPLYNLADSDVFGHGASFSSIRQVVDYKNAGQPQNIATRANLDSRFQPLGLTTEQVDDLTAFLTSALRDTNLQRYVPSALPSGKCFPVADAAAIVDLGC